MNSIICLMTRKGVKLGRKITFVKYLASIVFLIFLAKTLIWNKITFPTSNLLELVVNEPMNSIYKKFTNISFSIQFITA